MVDQASLAKSYSWNQVQILSSSDITLRDVLIDGYLPDSSDGAVDPTSTAATRNSILDGMGYGNGLLLRNTDDVVLEDLEISNLRVALRLNGADDTTITGLELHHTREGVNMNDTTDVLIADSYFHDLLPWYDPDGTSGDHPDFIQFWG